MYTTIEEIGARINSEFRIDVDEYFVRQHALDAVNEMGLISTEEILLRGTIKDYKMKIPASSGGITRINWVIAGDAKASTTVSLSIQNIFFPPQVVFTPVPNENIEIALIEEEGPINVIPSIRGPYIPFTWKKPFLAFNETERQVVVYAERLKLDPNTKLPLIPQECLAACAYYCVEVYYKPMFMLGKVPPFVWEKLEQWTNRHFARGQNQLAGKQLNQNVLNDAMDVVVSMDRKAYGIDS